MMVFHLKMGVPLWGAHNKDGLEYLSYWVAPACPEDPLCSKLGVDTKLKSRKPWIHGQYPPCASLQGLGFKP